MIKYIFMPEVVTTKTQEVTNWLRSKQSHFTYALSRFGAKCDLGFGIGTSYPTEFTGEGLCSFASAIAEEAIRERWAEEIETRSFGLYTYPRVPTSPRVKIRDRFSHKIVTYGEKGKSKPEFFTDPTFRQILLTTNPNKMLIGIPIDALDTIYDCETIYRQERMRSPMGALRFLPHYYEPGELHQINQDHIRIDGLEGVTIEDYLELFEVFRF